MPVVDNAETVGGKSKIERYGWTIVNSPGLFKWIKKGLLQIPNKGEGGYQRGEKKAHSLKKSAEWDWVACGALRVADRGADGLWVIDGQQRLLAAYRRDDIKELPCVVYVVESIHQEARSFVTSQKGRTAISAIEQYTADIVAKDPVAIAIGEMLSRLGLSADDSKKPNSVAFIYAIRNSFERDHFSCEQSLGLTHQICREHLASVGIFEGIFFCALHATENIFTPQYINKLCLAGKAQITQSINARRALHSMSGSSQRVSGTGVLDILNYKKRNKIGFKD